VYLYNRVEVDEVVGGGIDYGERGMTAPLSHPRRLPLTHAFSIHCYAVLCITASY
jgi:hypothetical protein